MFDDLVWLVLASCHHQVIYYEGYIIGCFLGLIFISIFFLHQVDKFPAAA